MAVPAVANPLTARMHKGINTTMDEGRTMVAVSVSDTLGVGANQTTGFATEVVAHPLRADGFDASEDGIGRGTPLVPIAFDTTQITSKANRSQPQPGDPCHPLAAGAHAPAIAFNGRMDPVNGPVPGAIDTDPLTTCVAFSCKDHGADAGETAPREGLLQPSRNADEARWAVRRLLPVECEKLQGFPPGYTDIPWRGKQTAPDGPRYKALGNSMAVNCMRWIGRRIELVDAL